MKKIIFCIPNMNLGGTEKALISMLSAIDYEQYDITIGLVQKCGKLIDEIPKRCKVVELPLPKSVQGDLLRGGAVANFKYYLKNKKIFRAVSIAVKKMSNNLFAELNTKFKKIDCLKDKYDIAVSYQLHNPFITKYVADKITASKKVVFVHNDLATTKYKVHKLINELKAYDKIYTVSKNIKLEVDKIVPSVKNKTEIFYNIVNDKQIKLLSSEFYPKEYDGNSIKILTVGRLNSQKGYELAINVAKKMIENNYNFKWFVIGEGELRKNLENLITEYGLREKFILLGSKSNPYPYIAECDIYCQTSLHEGYCTTTNEAKLLRKPILTTNVSGANEQFINNENAIITNINIEDIYNNLTLLIDKKEIRENFINNLEKVEWNEINKTMQDFLDL